MDIKKFVTVNLRNTEKPKESQEGSENETVTIEVEVF